MGIGTEVLPTGSATYGGVASVFLQDGSDVYDLIGTSSITVNFSTPQGVTTTLSNLDGKRIPSFGAIEDVTGIGMISVVGSTISGNTYAGGTAQLTSSQVNAGGGLAVGAVTELAGAFYGPNAEETGGVMIIDDTSVGGQVRIFSTFLAR